MKKSLTESALEKAQKLYDDSMNSLWLEPTVQPDELGYIRNKYSDYKNIMKHRSKLAWSNGACFMLASVSRDNQLRKDIYAS